MCVCMLSDACARCMLLNDVFLENHDIKFLLCLLTLTFKLRPLVCGLWQASSLVQFGRVDLVAFARAVFK